MRPSDKHSIDRINVNGNYTPGNVRWATQTEQNMNRRDNPSLVIEGISYKRIDLEKRYGVSAKTLSYRAKKGWPLARVIAKEGQWDTSSLPLAVKAAAEARRIKRRT